MPTTRKLTAAQVRNWQSLLFGTLGTRAMEMTENQIRNLRDFFDEEPQNTEKEVCNANNNN